MWAVTSARAGGEGALAEIIDMYAANEFADCLGVDATDGLVDDETLDAVSLEW